MPVHIEEMNVEMQVVDGELPLNEAQIERLVKILLSRLERQQREAGSSRTATSLRTQAAPQIHISE
jgi:hypothetical protein